MVSLENVLRTRILLADDELWYMEGLKDAFVSEGYEVIAEPRMTGTRVLEIMRDPESRIDVLILYIMMDPGSELAGQVPNSTQTGVSVLRKIREEAKPGKSDLPVICLTVVDDEYTLKQLAQIDSTVRILRKADVDVHDILEAVKTASGIAGNAIGRTDIVDKISNTGARKVFLSYVRENSEVVQRLYDSLSSLGVGIWLDRNDIMPGTRWQQAIRRAIRQGSSFIACFSKEYNRRGTTFMNEEITLAIEELRRRPTDQAWFIPVKLSECEIPDREIGGGETLEDLQYVELYKNWDDGIQKILSVIQSEPC